MQSIILAGGKGTRMNHLTREIPKPLLLVKGKSLIELKLDTLKGISDEVILVVGYLGDKIKQRIGDTYQGIKIKYAVQKELKGTADALFCAKDLLHEDFLVLMGDDLYQKNDLQRMAKEKWAILVDECKETRFGAKVVTSDGKVTGIIEKQNLKKGDLFNTGCYKLKKDIFGFEPVKIEGVDEFGLPQTLVSASKNFELKIVKATNWCPITSPEDIKKAELFLQ